MLFVRYLAMVLSSETRQDWSIHQADLSTLRGALQNTVTVSIFVAISQATARHSPTHLILLADRALYAAKTGGRDATRLAPNGGLPAKRRSI